MTRPSIAGKAVSATGAHLTHCLVCLVRKRNTCRERCVAPDHGGRFEFEAVLPGEYFVSAAADDHVPTAQDVTVGDGGGSPITPALLLTLARGGAIVSGRVLDGFGGPIVGALINVGPVWDASASGAGYSDDSGHFSVRAPEGLARVSASVVGYARSHRDVAAPASDVALVLAPASGISGTVFAADTGTPVQQAEVTARSDQGETATTQSDTDGTFAFDQLEAGTHELIAVADALRSETYTVATGFGETVTEVHIGMVQGAVLSGQVTMDGRPCAMASVQLAGPVQLRELADTDGSVRFRGVPLGRYSVTAECKDTSTVQGELTLSGGSTADQIWEVKRGLEIRGEVQSYDGKPISRGSVLADPVDESSRGAGARCHSGEDGKFACAGLAAGTYAVRAADEGGATSEPLEVALGEHSVDGVVLRFAVWGTLSVVVTSPDGRPRSDVPVFAKTDGRGEIRGIAAGPGKFVFNRIQPGRYEVCAGPLNSAARTTADVPPGGDEVHAALTVSTGGSISGRVVDEQGQPVGDAWLRAHDIGVPAGAEEQSLPVLTDSDGLFEIRDLVPGDYTVSMTSSTGAAEVHGVRTGSSPITIQVQSFGSLTGTVTRADGSPASSFQLTWSSAGLTYERQFWSPAGQWELSRLAPGAWTIEARSGDAAAREALELAPVGRVALNLKLLPTSESRGTAEASGKLKEER